MLTPQKAGDILRDGTVHGKPLTPKQRGLFGLIRGGGTPKKGVLARIRAKRRRK